jgi:hypothetical protein
LKGKYALVVVILFALASVSGLPLRAQGGLQVSIAPNFQTIDCGQPELFRSCEWYYSNVSVGSCSYQWYLNGTAVSGANGSSWTFTPQSTGSYTICLVVEDLSTGDTASSQPNATLTVNPAISLSISPSTVTMNVGQSQTFTESVAGGTPPYYYCWYLDDNLVAWGATKSSWTFAPSSIGSYNVTCIVADWSTTDVASPHPRSIASVTVNTASATDPFPAFLSLRIRAELRRLLLFYKCLLLLNYI